MFFQNFILHKRSTRISLKMKNWLCLNHISSHFTIFAIEGGVIPWCGNIHSFFTAFPTRFKICFLDLPARSQRLGLRESIVIASETCRLSYLASSWEASINFTGHQPNLLGKHLLLRFCLLLSLYLINFQISASVDCIEYLQF